MNRSERIAEARWFIWKGDKVHRTPDLQFALLDAHRRLTDGKFMRECPVTIDNMTHILTLTEVEDLLDLCRDSQQSLAQARAS